MLNIWPHLKLFRPSGCVGLATALPACCRFWIQFLDRLFFLS